MGKSIVDDICCIQDKLISCAKTQIEYGMENMNTDEFNAIMDGIKDMAESKYYTLVSEAMEEAKESPEMMGYSRPRMSGNYRMGYNDIMSQKPYIDGYLHDPNFESKMRGDDHYGIYKPYDRYKTAKRHYTETHDTSDKAMMDAYAKEHLTETIATMKDIWSDATPELKQKMKADLKALMEVMA